MNNRLNKDWRNKNWFWFAWHPLEEELLAFLDGELGVKPASKVQKHLEGCWACRAQREKIERSISVFINYRQAALAEAAATRRRAQTRFADKLSRLAAEQTEQKQAFFRHGTLAGQFSQFRPSLWATAVVLLSIGLGVWFGSDRQVTASELLRNATAAQAAKLDALAGPVVYQKLRVRRLAAASARPETANWEIWDDTTRGRFRQSIEDSGGRRLLPVTAGDRAARADQAPAPILAELTQLLAANHMDPRRPLSAASYQSWRDSIASKHEEVARTQLPDKREVLLLRTALASQVKTGQITEATFGVRAQDWLPCELRLKVKAEEGERIYEIIEQASEVVSLAQLSPEIFAAPPIIMPLKAVVALQPNPSPASTPIPAKANPAPPAVTAELEIEVLSLLGFAQTARLAQIEFDLHKAAHDFKIFNALIKSPESPGF